MSTTGNRFVRSELRAAALAAAISLMWGCAVPPPAVPEPEATGEAEAVIVVAFTEGPTVDAAGNVYFTQITANSIMKFTPGEGLSTFRQPANEANGLIIDAEGRLIACEGGAARVTRTNLETGEIEVIAENTPATPIDRPNDVTSDGQGRLYFTDYSGGRVYRIDRDGSVNLILSKPDIEVPNGIVISPDDKTLYHVEANGKEGGARCIRAYDLAADGTVGNMRVFHDFYPGRSADGLAIDSAGNVYAAAGLNRTRGTSETLDTKAGIHVFSPEGKLIRFYPIWEDTITNCAFGGEDMRTLYVTAGKTLFSVRTPTPGTPR